MDLNEVRLIGNIGRDPEFFDMQSGGRLCKFSMATTRKWKDKTSGETKSETQWHNVVVFNKYLVEVCANMAQKGTRVVVGGELTTRSYEKDGSTRYITEIRIPTIGGILNIEARGKGWNDTQPTSASGQSNPSQQSNDQWRADYDNATQDFDDGIPF